MIRTIIQMCFLIVIADITLLFFIAFHSTFAPERKFKFLLAGSISLLMVFCNIIMYLYQDTQAHRGLLKLFTAISYAISGSVVLPFVSLSSVISKKIQRILLLFASLNGILSFVSMYNGCIFSYNEQGYLTLGPLSPIPFYMSALYIAVLLVSSVLKFRLGFRGESVFLAILSLAVISAVVMNTVFGFKFLISGMAVLSCIFYYLFFTTQTLTRDALTNALNRHSFYKDAENLKKHQMFLISLDLNGLKQINDTRGHDAGDAAILAVAESVFSLLPPRCRFYRMGGDEFELLCPNTKPNDAEQLAKSIKATIEAKGYSAAVGIGEYKKGMDFDASLKEVDERMYADKKAMKAAR